MKKFLLRLPTNFFGIATGVYFGRVLLGEVVFSPPVGITLVALSLVCVVVMAVIETEFF